MDSLIVACCNAQAAQTDGSDLALAQGQEALNELRDLGWDEEVRERGGAGGACACCLFGHLVYLGEKLP